MLVGVLSELWLLNMHLVPGIGPIIECGEARQQCFLGRPGSKPWNSMAE